MRIGINTLFLIPNQVGGTEYYTRSLLKALEESNPIHHFVIFCNEENYDTFHFNSPHWHKVRCPVRASNRLQRVWFEQWHLPRLVERENCDLLHSFGYTAPLSASVPQVVTVHDANWLDHPEDVPMSTRWFYRWLMPRVFRVAQKIITDSHFSQEQLSWWFPGWSKKIAVVTPGVDPEFKRLLSRDQPFIGSVQHPYWLCVSGLYPHKQIPYLLKVWDTLAESDPTIQLVLVGQNGLDEAKVQAKIKNMPTVRWFPKVSFSELVGLYQQAQGGVFPSVYEGFGYPVYEAITAGLPVLVGKKECYEPEIRSSLHQLQFKVEADASLIQKMTTEKSFSTTGAWTKTYQHSARELIQHYEEVVPKRNK